jgi:hypothetical protein
MLLWDVGKAVWSLLDAWIHDREIVPGGGGDDTSETPAAPGDERGATKDGAHPTTAGGGNGAAEGTNLGDAKDSGHGKDLSGESTTDDQGPDGKGLEDEKGPGGGEGPTKAKGLVDGEDSSQEKDGVPKDGGDKAPDITHTGTIPGLGSDGSPNEKKTGEKVEVGRVEPYEAPSPDSGTLNVRYYEAKGLKVGQRVTRGKEYHFKLVIHFKDHDGKPGVIACDSTAAFVFVSHQNGFPVFETKDGFTVVRERYVVSFPPGWDFRIRRRGP